MRITNFFLKHHISKLCQLNDGHFVQTLTYVRHWRALNHKAIMNQWNWYKRGQITLNEELDFFRICWNDCCGSRAVRQMTWQMTWCWTISIYSADPHIRKVSFQPNFYSIYLSIELIMHKHVQLLILIGKPWFFFLMTAMDTETQLFRASVTTKTSAFGLGFCLLSPSGHVFHTARETLIKSYNMWALLSRFQLYLL